MKDRIKLIIQNTAAHVFGLLKPHELEEIDLAFDRIAARARDAEAQLVTKARLLEEHLTMSREIANLRQRVGDLSEHNEFLMNQIVVLSKTAEVTSDMGGDMKTPEGDMDNAQRL